MQLPFQIDLKNKVAVVTGGSGVLGSCMAQALAANGAKVVILGRSIEKAQTVVDAIRADGGTAMAVSADVLNKEALEAAAAQIAAEYGPCDILINGAGGNHPKGITTKEFLEPGDLGQHGEELTTFFDLTREGFGFVFDLNFLGTLLPCQVFGKGMVGREGCTIINISSMSAILPLTKVPAYSNAKAAVTNFTQWLAVHFAPVGIRVNAIAPGWFLTEQNRNLMLEADGSYTPRAQKVINNTPMKRMGNAEELLGALLWLVDSKAASFVTGSVIAVDGGFSAYSGV